MGTRRGEHIHESPWQHFLWVSATVRASKRIALSPPLPLQVAGGQLPELEDIYVGFVKSSPIRERREYLLSCKGVRAGLGQGPRPRFARSRRDKRPAGPGVLSLFVFVSILGRVTQSKYDDDLPLTHQHRWSEDPVHYPFTSKCICD
jgi:hypothetical protein